MRKSTMKKCAKRAAIVAAVAIPAYYLIKNPKLVAAATALVAGFSEEAREFLETKGSEIAEIVSEHAADLSKEGHKLYETVAEVVMEKAKEFDLV